MYTTYCCVLLQGDNIPRYMPPWIVDRQTQLVMIMGSPRSSSSRIFLCLGLLHMIPHYLEHPNILKHTLSTLKLEYHRLTRAVYIIVSPTIQKKMFDFVLVLEAPHQATVARSATENQTILNGAKTSLRIRR